MELFKLSDRNFGFGCMRLPMAGDKVNVKEFCKMTDLFLDSGFRYFDTAHGYLDGKSETALRECLTSRYPRDRYLLADKLSDPYFDSEKDIRPLFDKQLEACGVEYFDYYLMHALNAKRMEKFKACRAFEAAFRLKDEGKAKHIGMSFHDYADVLDKILTEYPQIEFVQLQFNYLDYESPDVQSRLCLETCRRHGKPVIVMEPVRGGKLADLPEKAANILSDIAPDASAASYALRFAAGCEGVAMVLSGMSTVGQVRDNVSVMNAFRPLSEKERLALAQVCGILSDERLIPCTACRYCTEQCPKQIPIPEILALLNARKAFRDWKTNAPSGDRGGVTERAADCVKCGRCEQACPQHLRIRELLESAQ